jgi:hypothetical protein
VRSITLDRRRAQGRQLGELLLQPAALDSEFLGEHLRFFGCLLSRNPDRVISGRCQPNFATLPCA